MAEKKRTARSSLNTPGGTSEELLKKNTRFFPTILTECGEDVNNLTRSELVKTAKAAVDEMYSKLFPNEKLAVCAVISVMINRRPTPIPDSETAARVRETLLSFAETEPQSRLAEYCRQAAEAITSQGGAT